MKKQSTSMLFHLISYPLLMAHHVTIRFLFPWTVKGIYYEQSHPRKASFLFSNRDAGMAFRSFLSIAHIGSLRFKPGLIP